MKIARRALFFAEDVSVREIEREEFCGWLEGLEGDPVLLLLLPCLSPLSAVS